jgi:hypothetical protein
MTAYAVTLDDTRQFAVAHLKPGDVLAVTAPPGATDIRPGGPGGDLGWMHVHFDDLGVRSTFERSALALAGLLNPLHGLAKHAMRAAETIGDEGGVARLTGHLEGTMPEPVWVVDGFEVVAPDGGTVRERVDAAITQLRSSGGDASAPEARALRAALIEEFGLRAAKAIVGAAHVESVLDTPWLDVLGEDGRAAVLGALREAVARCAATASEQADDEPEGR